jgi:hypothetical protein
VDRTVRLACEVLLSNVEGPFDHDDRTGGPSHVQTIRIASRVVYRAHVLTERWMHSNAFFVGIAAGCATCCLIITGMF